MATLQLSTRGKAPRIVHPDDTEDAGDEQAKDQDKQPTQSGLLSFFVHEQISDRNHP